MTSTQMQHDTVVIGAGPAGLAVAAALKRRGGRALVVDRAPSIGDPWRGHYDRLHLHTPRRLSALPGLPIPRRYGRWVGRDDVVRYLQQYADFHDLRIEHGLEIATVSSTSSDQWRLRTTDGESILARHVVVATGYNRDPVMPIWPGAASYAGKLMHASDYRNPAPFEGQRVLVAGIGNTGAEIAADLAGNGADTVWIAVRTPPHIVRRDRGPMSAQLTGIAVRRLPPRLVDRLARVLTRVDLPDLADYGLPRPSRGLYTRVLDGAIPLQDVGIIDAIQQQTVLPVPAIERFFGDDVILTDGRRIRPDVVIAATGYRSGLPDLIRYPGVLDDRGLPIVTGGAQAAPGLYFTGFTNPISGMLREMRIDAGKIARSIRRS